MAKAIKSGVLVIGPKSFDLGDGEIFTAEVYFHDNSKYTELDIYRCQLSDGFGNTIECDFESSLACAQDTMNSILKKWVSNYAKI